MKTLIGLPGAMDAGNFVWDASMKGDVCKMVVTHKFSRRTWERTFAEDEWPAVRDGLLRQIESDLGNRIGEASAIK